MRTAAILFYANYKVKTQNSAWEQGSLHSVCLNYVKKTGPHFYPKMHLDDYWRPFFSEMRLDYYAEAGRRKSPMMSLTCRLLRRTIAKSLYVKPLSIDSLRL